MIKVPALGPDEFDLSIDQEDTRHGPLGRAMMPLTDSAWEWFCNTGSSTRIDKVPGSKKMGFLIGPGAKLVNANLASYPLTGADLAGANLTNANLAHATLYAANLNNATLTGVLWQGTTCPDGTNSDNDGLTCVNNL